MAGNGVGNAEDDPRKGFGVLPEAASSNGNESFSVRPLIPARAGSKGIPGKNRLVIAGRSLLDWALLALEGARNHPGCAANHAGDSTLKFLQPIVFTDDLILRDEAAEANCITPSRPAYLSDDNSHIISSVSYVHEWLLANHHACGDCCLLLQLTNPFRTAECLAQAAKMIRNTSVSCIFSVQPVGAWHPARMYDGDCVPIMMGGGYLFQRQHLKELFIRDGAIYLFRWENLATGTIYGRLPAMMTRRLPQWNIDEPLDVTIANAIMERYYAPYCRAGELA